MTGSLRNQHQWVFCVAALALWFALGWPFLHELVTGTVRRDAPVPALWLVPYALFGAAVFGSVVLKLRAGLQWSLLGVQLAAVVAMTIIFPKDLMTLFLIIIAWQVAMATSPAKALGWVAFQTLAIVGTLVQSPNAYLSYIIALSLVLQLLLVFTARALRGEGEESRALAQANRELQAAQAIIANTARDAERLRISRELHDAWGHELTALKLQLEIASHVSEAGRANDHVMKAKGLARALLAKVRDVVAALRTVERGDLQVSDGAGHSGAASLWVQANPDGETPRLAALGDGGAAGTAGHLGNRRHWTSCVAALAVWLAVGWPILWAHASGAVAFDSPRRVLWLVAFILFGAAVLSVMALKLRTSLQWTLLCVQVAAVATMAFTASWAIMSLFLVIVAWQVALATAPARMLSWVAFQNLVVIGALALAPRPDLCWIVGLSVGLQLCAVFAADALRREAQTARALAETNRELQAAQATIASTVRDAERLRISRELHDAWGHELTALGLQLEIASHVTEPARANDHVMQAKGLAGALLGNVRDVVATLHEAERCDLKDALEALAQSVPAPAIHVDVCPDVRVSPDQAHALMRCAQEALTNAVRHAHASNLWLQVTSDGDGVRLVARNDGSARPTAASSGYGLIGMRERVESLGGKLAVRTGVDLGFTVDAWLPRAPKAA